MKDSTVYSSMIRLKAYIKYLSERGFLTKLRPADVPMNKTILRNPTYLTKNELKAVFKELDLWLFDDRYQKKKRDNKYAAYMLRALVNMLYATGLRSAELRNLKYSEIDISGLK